MSALESISEETRAVWLARAGDPAAHAEAMATTPALRDVETGGAAHRQPSDTLRVVAWNAERGGSVDAGAALLRRAGADVALLSELDAGMARSGNVHTAREIAARLGHGYLYGVEFLELGLGDRRERAALPPGATNLHGFHGNAIAARVPLSAPMLVRIESSGHWFRAGSGQPRVGGRMALLGLVELATREVAVASVHLESDSDPAQRAAQLEVVLDALDDAYGTIPAVIGGDLNTFSAGRDELRSADAFERLTEEDPSRWEWPVPYEPLFETAGQRGFSFVDANVRDATARISNEKDAPSVLHLDWLLVRGLSVFDPERIAALDEAGAPLSDHDAIAVTVAPPFVQWA